MALFPPISSFWGSASWGSIPWQGSSAPPPGTIQSISVLDINIEFGAGAVSLSISANYVLPINIEFGRGAVIEQTYISVFLNGVDISRRVLVNSIQITDQLAQPTTASFSIWDSTASIVPQVGQQVWIYLGTQRIFGGTIDQPFQTAFQAMPGSAFLGSAGGTAGVGSATSLSTSSSGGGGGAIHCTDFSLLLSRRYAGIYFDGISSPTPPFLIFMVQYLVANYLSGDGITYDDSNGDPGTNLGPQLFNWVTLQSAFNTLSSSTGWDFKIDPYGVLRFFPSDSGIGNAPFNISEGDGNVYAESLGVEYYRSTYRNRQGVASPSQQGQLWTDTYPPGPPGLGNQSPDGVRTGFQEQYPFTAIPTVYVNGGQQTVAESTPSGFVLPGGTPATNFQWYVVEFPSIGLFQNTNPATGGGSPLVAGDVLVIAYPSPGPAPILWVQDDVQIAARAAIEGNSGIYEDLQQAPSVTDPAAIAAYAVGLLARYGSAGMPFQVTYSSRNQKGVFSGQLQTIATTNPPVNVTGMISSVTWNDVDGQFMELAVTVLSGEYQGNFSQFFAALVAGTSLVPPANTSTYSWLLAPTVPGVVNPGITQEEWTFPQVAVVNNGVECLLYMTVNMAVAEPDNDDALQLLQNGTVIASVYIPPNATGPITIYPTPGTIYLTQGDVLQIHRAAGVVFPDPLKDASVIVHTVVLST
jgi:predicted outer membrane repeat protein